MTYLVRSVTLEESGSGMHHGNRPFPIAPTLHGVVMFTHTGNKRGLVEGEEDGRNREIELQ